MKYALQFAVRLSIIAAALLFGGAAPGGAQASQKVWRVGFLSVTTRDSFHDAFFKGFRELGYAEGRNVVVEARLAAVTEKRLVEAAAQLVKLRVDVIVARGTQATIAAKKATNAIPIVMTGSSDPVGSGLVQSLAKPGGNVTGMSILAPDLSQKRLELLRRVLLRASRVGIMGNPSNPGNTSELNQIRAASKDVNMTLVSRDVRQPKDIHRAFRSMMSQKVDAVLTLTDAILSSGRTEIVNLALYNRLPGVFHLRDFVEEGGLMSYGPDLHYSFYRAAHHVDRILKGARPADIPVEQPVKFELAINLQTAKQIGVTIPTEVLVLADRIVR
jgi:putative ABC transport system substrate-binding protein